MRLLPVVEGREANRYIETCFGKPLWLLQYNKALSSILRFQQHGTQRQGDRLGGITNSRCLASARPCRYRAEHLRFGLGRRSRDDIRICDWLCDTVRRPQMDSRTIFQRKISATVHAATTIRSVSKVGFRTTSLQTASRKVTWEDRTSDIGP